MAQPLDCLLGNSFGRTKLPGEISAAGIPDSIDRASAPDCFCSWNNKNYSNLNADVAKVLVALHGGTTAKNLSVVKVQTGQYAAEYHDSKGNIVIATANTKGQITASMISPAGQWMNMPSLPNKDVSVTAIYAALLMLVVETDVVNDPVVRSQAALQYDSWMKNPITQDSKKPLFFLSDIMSIGMKSGNIKGTITAGNVKPLSQDRVTHGALNGIVLCGSPDIIGAAKASTKRAQNITAKKAKEMFKEYADTKKWTKEEEQLIPQFPDDFPVMPEVIKIAKRFVGSRNAKRPMNNILWRGITAYGKSTGVELVAYILHTPLLRLTCNSTMDAQDFLSQFIPDNSRQAITFPSFMEIAVDPAGAYETLTGEYRDDVSADDVLEAYSKAAVAASAGNTARYKLIESNYVIALKKGYICEIQEMSRIKDAGVMVSLNEYDRAGALIPLANGTFCKRDPDAMVIYTDNIGYVSCRPVDPSVMRRMDCVLDSYELTDAQVTARVKYNTGFDDTDRLKHMLRVWKAIIKYCKENEITDGEISVNELERWANVLLIEGYDSYESACMECIVAKTSPDPETQKMIQSSVVAPLMEKLF